MTLMRRIGFRKAAEHGHANAQYNLGVHYRDGKGVKQNDAIALAWFEKAAVQGDSAAQSSVGGFYAVGRGCRKDYAKAYFWLRLATELMPEPSPTGVNVQAMAKLRDAVGGKLRPAQLVDEEERAQLWFAMHSTQP